MLEGEFGHDSSQMCKSFDYVQKSRVGDKKLVQRQVGSMKALGFMSR